MDESLLVLNLPTHGFGELLGDLDYQQAAPPLFLLAEKLVFETLGDSEQALRLLPLLAGLASLPAFHVLARRVLDPAGAVVALALFAICGPLVYFSSEVKPYGTDVAVTIGLLLLAFAVDPERPGRWGLPVLALAGAVAVWASFPAVFVLGGVALVRATRLIRRRTWRPLAGFAPVMVAWLGAFVALYIVTLDHVRGLDETPTGGDSSFVPESAGDVDWLTGLNDRILGEALGVGLGLAGVAVLLLVVGIADVIAARDDLLWMITAPVALALLASLIGEYPLGGRFALFAVPSLVILIALGAQHLLRRAVPVVAGLALGLLFLGALRGTASEFLRPGVQELPTLLERIEHRDLAQPLYVSYFAQYPLTYYLGDLPRPADAVLSEARARASTTPQGAREGGYAPTLASLPGELVVGDHYDRTADQLQELRGLTAYPRMTVILSDTRGREDSMIGYLDSVGRRVRAYEAKGVSAYVYDFRRGGEVARR